MGHSTSVHLADKCSLTSLTETWEGWIGNTLTGNKVRHINPVGDLYDLSFIISDTTEGRNPTLYAKTPLYRRGIRLPGGQSYVAPRIPAWRVGSSVGVESSVGWSQGWRSRKWKTDSWWGLAILILPQPVYIINTTGFTVPWTMGLGMEYALS